MYLESHISMEYFKSKILLLLHLHSQFNQFFISGTMVMLLRYIS
jgi:hypothetical protein